MLTKAGEQRLAEFLEGLDLSKITTLEAWGKAMMPMFPDVTFGECQDVYNRLVRPKKEAQRTKRNID